MSLPEPSSGKTKIDRFLRSSYLLNLKYYSLFLQIPNTGMYLSTMCYYVTGGTKLCHVSHIFYMPLHNTEEQAQCDLCIE